MVGTGVFSVKAGKYEKYRWRYAPQSIQAIFEVTGIVDESCVADIGAGTGILTRELAGKVGRIFAVEPNPEMRAIARRVLARFPSCRVVDGRAEATTLPPHSLDLIAAAQAAKWFEPLAAKQEFLRILKPAGWLAFLRNYAVEREWSAALEKIYLPDLDTGSLMLGKRAPRSFYYGKVAPLKLEFPFLSRLPWEGFIGTLSTASSAPDEGSPAYADFERRARQIFDDFNVDGFIEQQGVTELFVGQMQG